MKIAPERVKRYNARLAGLETERFSYFTHWGQLAEYILPRRYKWTITANASNKGSPINSKILDATGTLAARTLAAGMMSGITSPTRPWFKLRLTDIEADDNDPVSLWLAECERRMMRVFAESNFYTGMATLFFDLAVFGTAPMLLYEDFDDVIRCYNPCAGEYYVANNSQMKVDVFYREFVLTIDQIAREFGIENASESLRLSHSRGGAELNQEVVIRHAIEPDGKGNWVECYWERGCSNGDVLRQSRFNEFPLLCPRWDLVSNDAYGRSPCMDALGDVKQLQQMTLRKAQAVDKMVNPPMIADIQLKNQPASFIPGGVTYVAGAGNVESKLKPVYQVAPNIADLSADIALTQQRIKEILFNDLFLMISSLDTVRTATEIDARREEKLIMLGPVLDRFENEALDPAINRVFSIMQRGGLLPPPPEQVQGAQMQIQYVSMLAEAQRATSTVSVERLIAFVGNLSAVDQTVMDNIDLDEATAVYGEGLNVDPRILRSTDAIIALREQRAQQVASQQAMDQVGAAAQSAKVVSETDVGGGVNALQYILGNA